MICLDVAREGEAGAPQQLRHDKDELLLGRSAEADVLLDDEKVSLFHLRLLRKDGALLALDLGSANGSWLDGARLVAHQPQRLAARSRLVIGPFRIEVREAPLAAADTAAVARQAARRALDSLGAPPHVEVVDGPNRGLRLPLPPGCPPQLVGRDAGCALRLSDADVSRQHLLLCWQGAALVARDGGSKNGFRVNGERVRGERALQHGDELSLGGTQLRYSLGDEQPGFDGARASAAAAAPGSAAAAAADADAAAAPAADADAADAADAAAAAEPTPRWPDLLTLGLSVAVVAAVAAAIIYLLL